MMTGMFTLHTTPRPKRPTPPTLSSVLSYGRQITTFLGRPIAILRTYRLEYLRNDLIAGLTVAIITLPQAIAFALISDLPAQVGLYTAIIGSIVGALWGSSNHLQTGPTNTTSLLVLSTLLSVAAPGAPEYLAAAGTMALLVGMIRLLMGLARLGVLVNFVSDSVIIGFTSGAGILLIFNQLRNLLNLNIPSAPTLWQTIPLLATHLHQTHSFSLLIGLGTIIIILLVRRINRKWPGPLIAMIIASATVAIFRLDTQGVRIVGELPNRPPPLVCLPLSDWQLIGRLFSGSLAVAVIGLVETVSIARTIAVHSGQRLDSNQEFVGQGLANIASAFFSGYTCAGSFTRSPVNYEAGARTPLSSALSGLFVLIAILALAPLAAYVPLSALAGTLILTAHGLINRERIARVWRSTPGDRLIMATTTAAALILPLQFAVFSGIALSVGHYLLRTSKPRVHIVLPDEQFRHFVHQPDKPQCPQLGIIEVLGNIYFGATNHVEEAILNNIKANPEQRFLLLRLQAVEHCDISGIYMLESVVRTYRERGGDVYLARVRRPVIEVMHTSGFDRYLGQDHFLDQDTAIHHLFYHVLDPAICIYECPVRAFSECQNLPKYNYPHAVRLDISLPPESVPSLTPQELWQAIHRRQPIQIIDVREPREFAHGHIPGAQHIPLPVLPNHLHDIARDRPVVIVCQGGRRSTRATALLREQGLENVQALRGGMIAWQQANLLEAIDVGAINLDQTIAQPGT